MSALLNTENGVNGASWTNDTTDASPGRVCREEQQAPGRNPATAKLKWTKR